VYIGDLMIKHDVLGFSCTDDYLEYFVGTLIPTNRTYQFYVNWDKIKKNLDRYITEISLLNSLTHVSPSERKDKLKELISKYPEVISVIPLIIAIRDSNLLVLEIGEEYLFREFDFSVDHFTQKKLTSNDNDVELIVDFCDKSGILDLFNKIKDLFTYLNGVEVGLDSNARKNRSGKIFEQIIELFLKKELKKLGSQYSYISEDSSIKIGKSKRIDFVIYKEKKPIIALECNFYSWSGGKGIEVAGSYADLQRRFKEKNLEFIWVSDGPGWAGMKNTLTTAFEDLDYLLNYKIFEKNFTKILKEIGEN